MMGAGSSYVGEGELARIVKICHNVYLGVVTQSLAEITVLAQKAGVPRHAFLDFLNQSVMGSMFTRYKTPAFVNLDFKVTFTPHLLRKDLDLGLDAGARFRSADAARLADARPAAADDRAGLTEQDFSTLLLQQAKASGMSSSRKTWRWEMGFLAENDRLRRALGFWSLGARSRTGAATSFPNKPVRLIISFTPGSSTDIVGRVVAAKLHGDVGPAGRGRRTAPGAGGSIGSGGGR